MPTPHPRPIVILKMGTASTAVTGLGDFEDWVAAGLDPTAAAVTVDVPAGGHPPDPATVSGAVVTGSSAMVTDRKPWSEAVGTWLVEAVRGGLPVLGICYGHQLLADALGGSVGDDPNGREIGLVDITREAAAEDDALLGDAPFQFHAQATHVQSVLTLPPEAELLATGAHTRIQAFRFGVSAWGVQFHPEFGPAITSGYIHARTADLRAEGIDPDARLSELEATPDASALLPRFASFVASR